MTATEAGEMQALTFELGGEIFALEAGIVQEILDLLPETEVPGASRLVGSVINFRGKVIPLADLRLAFGMEAAAASLDSRIVVVELDLHGEAMLVGLRTDKVREVAALGLAASEAPPSVGMRWPSEFIRRLVRRDGEVVVVPDLQALFSFRNDASAAGAASQLRL
ncbi:MAG: chemotaxis protein CheW [Phenylobacterium sp.]|uniref:chemotaxis protein CheW n=1 Tax=Phenylobacterium sp. TaxID=1871053 RepID=UPI00391A7444